MKTEIKFNYNVPLIESIDNRLDGIGDFIIQGTALNATTTSNNHKFLAEELEKSANTLIGVPLLIDHKNEVEAIKGRVLNGEYDEQGKRVNFKANVIDIPIRNMIKNGSVNSVSVGCIVDELEELEDGFFIPRGITFKELSLVAVPADSGATFDVALQESYNKLNQEDKMRYNWGAVGNSKKHTYSIEPSKEKKILKGFSEKQIQEMLNKSTKKAIKSSIYTVMQDELKRKERAAIKAEVEMAKRKIEKLNYELGIYRGINKEHLNKEDKESFDAKEKELSRLKELVFQAEIKLKSEESWSKFKGKNKKAKLTQEKIGRNIVSIIK